MNLCLYFLLECHWNLHAWKTVGVRRRGVLASVLRDRRRQYRMNGTLADVGNEIVVPTDLTPPPPSSPPPHAFCWSSQRTATNTREVFWRSHPTDEKSTAVLLSGTRSSTNVWCQQVPYNVRVATGQMFLFSLAVKSGSFTSASLRSTTILFPLVPGITSQCSNLTRSTVYNYTSPYGRRK